MGELGERAAAAIAADPTRSDVVIGEAIGVSRDTVRLMRPVGAIEKRIGKDGKARRLPDRRRINVNKYCDVKLYMREYMRKRRAAERERKALLAPSRPQPNDPPALVSFRARLRETTDPEAQAQLRTVIAHLEKLYGQQEGGIVAGEAILPATRSFRPSAVLHFGRTLGRTASEST